MAQACEYIFRDNRAIIIREYNSGQKQSYRSYAFWQRIVIGKNAEFWRLHLVMRSLVAVCLIFPIFAPSSLVPVAGNLFGLGALKKVRLQDVIFPE